MPIERRGHVWFAYLDVPADVRSILRRRVLRKTLKTDSRAVAMRRAAPLIAQWKSQIARAREEPDHNDTLYWREAYRNAKTDDERSLVGELIEDHLWREGFDRTDPEAVEFYFRATGAIVGTTEHLDEWIASQQVKPKTAAMRRATVERLAQRFRTLDDVSRKEVRRWATDLSAELKPATVQRMMSDCRTYWNYLVTIEAAPEDSAPFDRLGLKVKQSSWLKKSSWLPYTPEEAVRLLKAAEGDQQLADAIRMAMYSGARREELCALKCAHVSSDRFEIVDSKTRAGVRTVPIHPKLKPTFKRLLKASTDGYVLFGLKANANGTRGDAIGKRFTRLKRSLGFDDRHTFHSFRGTVITMLERAGVPEGTVQDIVGHERSTLTGSVYSGKSTPEMRQDAIKRLIFPNS